ncbi:MAG: MFS transporter [Aminipila sp.]
MKKLLNMEYSSIHGTYWMYYGVICSFASVFLLEKNYTNSEIGVILAVGNIVAVMLQPIMADIADRSKRLSIIGLSQIMTLVLMLLTFGMFVIGHKSIALSIIFVLNVAWLTVLQPLFNSLSFKLQESGLHINFGIARSMGSLAYSILCAILGTFVEIHGVAVLPITGEIVLFLLLISLALTKFHFNKSKETTKEVIYQTNAIEEQNVEEINLVAFVKRNKIFMIVNIGILGIFFSNAILNSFMMQIVSNVGGNSEDMGRIFAVMAFLEIPTMFCFDWLKTKFSCQLMLKVASVCFTLKIGACFLAQSVPMIFAAQLLQLFSFALFLPAMVHFIDEIMRKGEAVKGQALFTMTITVTSVIANLIGGVILDISGATLLNMIATIVTGIGAVIIFTTIDKVPNKN